MEQDENLHFTDTLCAETTPVGEDCGGDNVPGNITCKFRVHSSLHNVNAYRINFNTHRPGYVDASGFKSACSTLSNAIAVQTGTNPNLKPVCNHMSTGTGYCDYDTARFTGAYLSQCSKGTNALMANEPLPITSRRTCRGGLSTRPARRQT